MILTTMAPVQLLHLICLAYVIITGAWSQGDGLEYPSQEGVVYARLNTDAILTCGLLFPFDEEFLTLFWFKGSTYLLSKGNTGKIEYSYNKLKQEYKMDLKTHSLTVLSVSKDDIANYTCVKHFIKSPNTNVMKENKTTELIVQDDNNNTLTYEEALDKEENITLNVSMTAPPTTSSLQTEDIPSPPGMPVFDAVTSTTAHISWKESLNDNNSPIISYLVDLKKNDDDWEDSKVILVTGNNPQITLQHLVPYTPYQVRVRAKNAMGNSEPSISSSIFITEPEDPSVAPRGLNYTTPESTKIELTWTPPPDESVNGIVKGYIISYIKLGTGEKFEFTLADPARESVVIEKLEPFTNYTISILMYNDIGNSPSAFIHVTTAEGVPDKPRILHCSETKSTSFVVNWEAPKVENGILKNYQLQWIRENIYKTRIITGHLTNPMSAKISSLEPYTSYKLRVRAETGGGYSDYSSDFPAVTDVKGPSEPTEVNVTVLSPKDIFLHWKKPREFYKNIDSYFIKYWSVNGDGVRGEVVAEGFQYEKVITDLPTNNAYKLQVAGVTRSLYSQAHYIGEFSEEILFKLEDPTVIISPSKVEVVPAGMIAGIVLAVLIISAVILLFVCYRSVTCRKYTRSLYYLTVPTNSHSPQSTVVFPPEAVEESKYREIDIANFLYHLRQMHADSDNGFAMEFEDIGKNSKGDANGMDIPAEISNRPENKNKNRYVNITAYDHTRVILQVSPGKPKSSDYINGNFIDGYMKPNAYVATQGPLPHTFADFWHMVWEQGSIVIVMITHLVERGRRKCDQYWPDEGSETYGTVTVKHINTFSRAHFTVRMFSLKSSKSKKKHVFERIVYQYHYTEWPDHGVPEFTIPVLKFVLKSSNENPPGAGPIIIHCSAGVGRTGTYILIDTMIRQIKDKHSVNIPAFLLHIRQQRKYLVQTEEQYMLIHDAIAEYILTQGETEIRDADISKYVSDLTRQMNGEIAPITIQYNLVTSYCPKPDDKFHALKPVNVCKNRTLDMVPQSVKRVMLPMKPGIEGSDYINATYLHGYNRSNEFIITQHPLEQTVEDFWRMVWDQNSCVIVQLSDADEDEFKSYWPAKDSPVDIGCFKLTYREDDERKKYNIKEFILESTQDDYVLMTRIISPNMKWPESCHPIHQVFDLIDEVQMLHKQNDTGAVVVVDRYGGVEAATFSALWSIYDQMQYDKSVNIYQLSKLYHLKRSGVIGSKENYLFLFQAAESLSKEWTERDKQSSPGSIRLNVGSMKKNGTFPKNASINSKPETSIPRSSTINSKMESPGSGNGTLNSNTEPIIDRRYSINSKTETDV